MNGSNKTKVLGVLAFVYLLFILGMKAEAATIDYSYTQPVSATDWQTTYNVQQFDSSLGTLQSVTITISSSGSLSGTITAGPTNITILSGAIGKGVFAYSTQIGSISLYSSNMIDVAPPFIPVAANQTYNVGQAGVTGNASQTLTSNLNAFIGSGSFDLVLGTMSITSLTVSGGTYTYDVVGNAGATVTVTYEYEPSSPVPEPSTLLLLGSGLVALGSIAHRRRRKVA